MPLSLRIAVVPARCMPRALPPIISELAIVGTWLSLASAWSMTGVAKTHLNVLSRLPVCGKIALFLPFPAPVELESDHT